MLFPVWSLSLIFAISISKSFPIFNESSNSSEIYSSDDFEFKGVIKVSIAENKFTKSLDNVEK